MKMKERILAVLRREKPDRIPFTIYTFLLPRSSIERQLRNMGLSLVELAVSVYGINTPNVKMETAENLASFSLDDRYTCIARQKHTVDRTYTTPTGRLSDRCKWGYAAFEWPIEWVIKDLGDYEVVKYVIDNTEYFPNYEDFVKMQNSMGDDGIAVMMTPKSPLQSMLLDLMGYTRFSLDYYSRRHEFEDLYAVLRKKQLEMYKIIADSPAEVVLMDENLNGMVTGPKLFEKYCMPFYEEVAQILHAKEKILMAHMDGKLKCLRDLIGKTKIDVVEAFTPPPIGDLQIEEARIAWKEKVIWATFPATSSLERDLDGVEAETLNILRRVAPGDGFIMGVTEDIGDIKSTRYEEVLAAITETMMKHGEYPLSERLS